MNKHLEDICRMTQKQVKQYVTEELAKEYENVVSADGFVYAQGTFPVLLVAHMDTVHKKTPSVIAYDADGKTMSSPQGIGGDDRCGIYMILEIIKRFACSVLFCEDEEIGTVGATKFVESKLANDLEFNYIIELDRRGKRDAVFYDCANDDFEEFVTKEFFVTEYGSFTDISVIAPYLGCAAVNLSCGYYKAHTVDEYIVLADMERVIEEACKLLDRTTEEDKFEYIESAYSYRSLGAYGYNDRYSYDCGYGYDGYDADGAYYYIIEYMKEDFSTDWYETTANSKAEAIGKFATDNPKIPYENVIDIMVDNNLYS